MACGSSTRRDIRSPARWRSHSCKVSRRSWPAITPALWLSWYPSRVRSTASAAVTPSGSCSRKRWSPVISGSSATTTPGASCAGASSAAHRLATFGGSTGRERQEMLLPERLDDGIHVALDLLVDVAGRPGLRRAAPHELVRPHVVQTRLRDVDVVLVDAWGLVVAEPGGGISRIETDGESGRRIVVPRADVRFSFHPDQPGDENAIGVGAPHRLLKTSLVNLAILGDVAITGHGIHARFSELRNEFVLERAANAGLLAHADHQDPVEAGRGVLGVVPLIDDLRRRAAGRAERQRHCRHEKPERQGLHTGLPFRAVVERVHRDRPTMDRSRVSGGPEVVPDCPLSRVLRCAHALPSEERTS